jgi:hypothetical protein
VGGCQNTVRYHLDMLIDHNVLETSGDDYGKVYFVTDQFKQYEETFEQITAELE